MFFVVPGNGQVLLGLPDMVALNIINLNIDSIQKEIRECKTNKGRETHAETEDCTNKAAQSAVKQDCNGQQHQTNKLINYFYRVATAWGKQGIWMLTFPDRENTGNLVILIFTQGKLWQHRENFECLVCIVCI